MEQSGQIHSLLEEIRDLQKAHLTEYKEQAARSIRLAEDSVARQKAMSDFYRRVVFAAATLIVALLGFLWYSMF